MPEITTENAADEIIVQTKTLISEIINRDTNIGDEAARSLITYLIIRDVWSQLAEIIGLTPNDLREEASNMEEEMEYDEDEDEDDD